MHYGYAHHDNRSFPAVCLGSSQQTTGETTTTAHYSVHARELGDLMNIPTKQLLSALTHLVLVSSDTRDISQAHRNRPLAVSWSPGPGSVISLASPVKRCASRIIRIAYQDCASYLDHSHLVATAQLQCTALLQPLI